jgi:ribosomal-protein-alanine N-acetyltransferase
MIVLAPVTRADRDALFAFELANRAFFEAHINARAAGYYSVDGVTQAIQTAIDDVAADRGYQFLVKSADGEILGRINLRDVARGEVPSATLGYRIAAAHGGQGHASAAVRMLLDIAFAPLGLRRIAASARVSNLGSVRVLQRTGFTQVGTAPGSFLLGGVWHDKFLFEQYAA